MKNVENDKLVKEIYSMDMHDYVEIPPDTEVFRVPGGWVYKFYYVEGLSVVFVPMNYEFKAPLPYDPNDSTY